MTLTADPPSPLPDPAADPAPLSRDLLVRVREARKAADAAELVILELALAYAAAHPALPGQEAWQPAPEPAPVTAPVTVPVIASSWLEDTTEELDQEEREWLGLPALRWDAPAAFAAANAMTTTAGKALLRDVLVLAHRLPQFWAQVQAGRVPAWRARYVAQAALGQPADVCAYLDREVTGRVRESRAIGLVVLHRIIDEAMLRLHAEQRELEQLEALDARQVRIDPATINHTGIGAMDARADWADLAPFDQTLTQIAHALGRLPEHQHDSLQVRRSIALGVLADPTRAQALLASNPDGDPTGGPEAEPTQVRQLLAATLELSEANLLGLDPIATDTDQRAHLDQVIRAWAGRHDIALTVRPIRHCGGTSGGCTHCHTDCPAQGSHRHPDNHPGEHPGEHPESMKVTYTPTARTKETVQRRDRTCVHPHCNRPARDCDCDHIKAFAAGGTTCPCNLAPLCRHHHRLKTHAGWHYWKLGPPGTYLWRDPHGLLYLRTRHGTRTLE